MALYKEVQEYYEDGFKIPEDVTLLFADDNFGTIRRLPSELERHRSGGSGVWRSSSQQETRFLYRFRFTTISSTLVNREATSG
jgi:hypothetical protein